ncbi:ribosomal protein S12 methylthiotransferase accessory factor [Yoonia tamlensis]|uniref:Ribosomal protein S12 methylthiotransferase accessory factor n=1 Tax=Yoonia tamlensis TaxID=390270 RepID=A0A1I6HEI1_9RHOB|nr:YcaO-like family protein [Yoonia tamlensis]SFR52893.1 ribosomal protein S12 methylthiotransferase accessory factor [Yoonia tamlensis]
MNDSQDAIRLTAALVSRRSGIVTDLSPQTRGPQEPSPPHLWNATLTHYNFRNLPIAMRLTGGKGLTEDAAKLAALGEAMERYAAFHWDPSRLQIGPVPANAITPPETVLYSAAQYAGGLPFHQWSPESETTWIKGVDLSSGQAVDMPASLVYLVGPPPRAADYFTAVTSNGLAAGRDLNHAILGGLNEIIERDAFMITWLNKLPATTIETPQSGCYAAQIISHYERFGVNIGLLSLYTDQAPYVIMAIAQEQNGSRVVGLGCDCDPATAVDKAMFELCQLRPGMAARMQGGDYQTRLKTYADVRSIDDHPLFHAIPAHAGEFDFLTSTGAQVTLDDLPRPPVTNSDDLLDFTIAGAVNAGARVAYADITTADIAPLGPRVVRVIATGMQPIHFGHGQVRLGGDRLFEAPVKWGLRTTQLTENGLNQCPHPLA